MDRRPADGNRIQQDLSERSTKSARPLNQIVVGHEACSGAATLVLGMVRLVKVVLESGKLASPPPAMPALSHKTAMSDNGFTPEEFERLLPLVGTIQQRWEGMEACIKDDKVLPAMILAFTLIDSLAWLSAPKRNGTDKGRFAAWVKKWLFPIYNPELTAEELYSARCSLIHTLSSHSKQSQRGRARRAVYYRDHAHQDNLLGKAKSDAEIFFTINCDKFISAAKSASVEFLGSSDVDSRLRPCILDNTHSLYYILPTLPGETPTDQK
jgi:hypothetical protein